MRIWFASRWIAFDNRAGSRSRPGPVRGLRRPLVALVALASLLGTIRRADGTTQVAYNGHPLYYYDGDSGAGQLNGQDVDAFGAKWFVVTPAGGADTVA